MQENEFKNQVYERAFKELENYIPGEDKKKNE